MGGLASRQECKIISLECGFWWIKGTGRLPAVSGGRLELPSEQRHTGPTVIKPAQDYVLFDDFGKTINTEASHLHKPQAYVNSPTSKPGNYDCFAFWSIRVQTSVLDTCYSYTFVIILCNFHLCPGLFQVISFSSPKPWMHTSPVRYTCHMPRPSHFSWFDHPNDIWW